MHRCKTNSRANRRASRILAVAALAAVPLLICEAAARADVIQTNTGKCARIVGFSETAGAPLIQDDCPGNEFALHPTYDGYYVIIAKHSSLCLQVEAASDRNGARIVQWGCHYGENQKFTLGLAGSRGFRRLMVQHSGKCLTVDGGDIANGTSIVQWTCHSGFNQKFRLLQTPALEPAQGEVPADPPIPTSAGPGSARVRGGWPAMARRIIAWPLAQLSVWPRGQQATVW